MTRNQGRRARKRAREREQRRMHRLLPRNPYGTAYVAWLVAIVDSFEWRGENNVNPQVPEGFDAWFESDKPPPVHRAYQALTREDLLFD